jgi:hypothetical protein
MDPSKINKALFVGAFVLGAALIAGLRLIPESDFGAGLGIAKSEVLTWFSFAAPNVIILLYAAFIGLQPKSRQSPSDADNLYYLGFLYTVASLGVALILYSKPGANSPEISIIGSFGLALSTTIVGLVARTVLAHHAVDIEEQDEHARIQLHTATNEFINALTGSTERLSVVFDQNTTQLGNAFAVASEAVSKKMPDESKALVVALSTFTSELNRSLAFTLNELQKFPDAIKQATERIDTEHSELLKKNMALFTEAADGFMTLLVENNKKISSLGTAIERLSARVEEVPVSEDLISGHVERVYSVYSSAASKSAEQFRDSSATFVSALQHYSDAAMELSKRLATFSDMDGTKLSGAVAQVLEPLKGVTQDLALAARDVRSVGQNLSATGNQFEGNISRLSEMLDVASIRAEAVHPGPTDDFGRERI